MYESTSCYDDTNDDNITKHEWCDDMNTIRVSSRSENEWHDVDDASTTEWKVVMWASDACEIEWNDDDSMHAIAFMSVGTSHRDVYESSKSRLGGYPLPLA